MANHTTNERLVNLHRLVQKLHQRFDALEYDTGEQDDALYTIARQQREFKELLVSFLGGSMPPKRSLFRRIFGWLTRSLKAGLTCWSGIPVKWSWSNVQSDMGEK